MYDWFQVAMRVDRSHTARQEAVRWVMVLEAETKRWKAALDDPQWGNENAVQAMQAYNSEWKAVAVPDGMPELPDGS